VDSKTNNEYINGKFDVICLNEFHYKGMVKEDNVEFALEEILDSMAYILDEYARPFESSVGKYFEIIGNVEGPITAKFEVPEEQAFEIFKALQGKTYYSLHLEVGNNANYRVEAHIYADSSLTYDEGRYIITGEFEWGAYES